MRSAGMGAGDYLCITVRGGAPWGFALRQGEELHRPLLVCQVDTRGRGAQAGLREGDEVVSLNGEPCADLTLQESVGLMDASDSLQLLVKRCGVSQLLAPDSQSERLEEGEPSEAVESTTLEVSSLGTAGRPEASQEGVESTTLEVSSLGKESTTLEVSSLGKESTTLEVSSLGKESTTLEVSSLGTAGRPEAGEEGVESTTLEVSSLGKESTTLEVSSLGKESPTLEVSSLGKESTTLEVSSLGKESTTLEVSSLGKESPTLEVSSLGTGGGPEASEEGVESTTLEVWSSGGFRGGAGGGPESCESQDEAYYGETESDGEPRGETESDGEPRGETESDGEPRGETESDGEPRGARSTPENPRGDVAPGTVVELRVSLPPAHAVAGGGAVESAGRDPDSSDSKHELIAAETPKQTGDPATSSSSPAGRVVLTLPHPGLGWGGVEQEEEGGREEREEEEEEEEERGRVLSDPPEEGGSRACVSFGVSAVGGESAEERDSESERDPGRPSKHRARHARLRRSESQSEKQVKEAKSKCKRIALLLTATPNATNKGVLMFKRRRQRAKKYTLVSYGTGETEPEDEDDEEEEDYEEVGDDRHIELTLLVTSESELSEDLSAIARGRGGGGGGDGDGPGHDWDTALLEVERKVDARDDMEHLPGTKGKGALMFARRRQRVDEITAEHEEMRRKGIPVEGLPVERQDVPAEESPPPEEQPQTKTSVPQPLEQTFQQQQYQEQPQQQNVPTQQCPQVMNGTAHLHANDSLRSLVANRTAKPFSGVQNRVPAPFSPSRSVTGQALPRYTERFRVAPAPVPVSTRPQVWSPTGELIASRDERISVPAIKMLPDTRKRVAARATLHATVSPDPPFSSRGDKRAGFESGPEEDFLSLGAEACNFMQTPTVRSKDPPPVAPKPSIDPASPPWANRGTTQSLSHQPQSRSPLLSPGLTSAPAQPQPPRKYAPVSPWMPRQAHPQSPKNAWTPPQPQANPQPPMTSWSPQPVPVSTAATTQTHAPLHRPTKSWDQPPVPARSAAPRPMNSYPHAARTSPAIGEGSAAEGLERSAMRGRGAELFARRQARMEKFVVDADTVQANKVKPSSPTPSLPCSWRFSSNVRAPPPLSYNPILTPFYPLAAVKQPPPTSPKPKAKIAAKPQPPPKHLNAVDVMRHQPYQLNPSLFTYAASPEAKSASPKLAPTPDSSLTYSPSPAPTPSPVPTPTLAPGVPQVQSPGPVSVPYPFARQRLSPESQNSLSPALHDGLPCPAPASPHAQPRASFTLPSFLLPPKAASVTGVPAAPRPKFSAKKSLLATKMWKPVLMGQ